MEHCAALKNDLIVLLTDGEESGLLGADAFASSHPWMNDVSIILNFEGRGNHGPSLLFETSQNNGFLIKAVAHSASHRIGSSLFYSLYKLLPNDTDLTVFRVHDIPALNFAFGENLEAYHSRLDTAGNLSADSLQHHGSYALSPAQYFGTVDLTQLHKQVGDYVFFDWLGSHLIVYADRWVLPGEIFVTIFLACAILLTVRRSRAKLTRVLWGLLPVTVIVVGVSAVLGAMEWLLSMWLARHLIAGDSLANACLLIGLILFGSGAGALLLAICRRRFSVQEISIAGLVLICLLSWISALILPAGNYLLFWPLLFATVGLLLTGLMKKDGQPYVQNLPGSAGAVITVLFFAPIIYLLYIFLTLQLITAIAIGFLLGLFLIISVPFISINTPRHRWPIVPVILFVCGLTMTAIGIKNSVYGAEHPRHDSTL